MIFTLGTISFILLAVSSLMLLAFLVDHLRSKKKNVIPCGIEELLLKEPPGPTPWPILGSLHIMGQYDVPYKAFGPLETKYNSSVIKMKLGSVSCIVVNGMKNIREVLYTKGSHFDARPNFIRFKVLFGGNRENSLAFCNWSDIQKTRRDMLRPHTFLNSYTTKFSQLSSVISTEMSTLIDFIASSNGEKLKFKDPLLRSCANVFTNYFCSKRFDFSHQEFSEMVSNFDRVFYEVNMGYLVDFVPAFMPFYLFKLKSMKKWSESIREFVNQHIIQSRFDEWNSLVPDEDYVDSLIRHVRSGAKPEMSWDKSLFALEDIIGGHSAIGNFLMKIFGYLVTRPQIQKIAQQQIDQVQSSSNIVALEDKKLMPYVEAIILESIRLICSPIVPHVANQDTSIAGYKVEKDNFIFLNNYELHMSEKLWIKPEDFAPERFIQNGHIVKPEYFLPFGGGVRSCMGYKLVQYISFVAVASILKNFTILPVNGEKYNIPIGYLAMPVETYSLRFEQREKSR